MRTEPVPFSISTYKNKTNIIREPNRSAEEVIKIFGISTVRALHSRVTKHTFPMPDFISSGINNTNFRKYYWKLSTINKELKRVSAMRVEREHSPR